MFREILWPRVGASPGRKSGKTCRTKITAAVQSGFLVGNDERLRVAYNDVDLGLRIRQAGYENVYTPYARLIHNEGASRKGAEQGKALLAQRLKG